MLSKSNISLIKSLKIGKYRSKEKLFVVEGKKSIGELLKSDFVLRALYVFDNSIQVPDKHIDKVVNISSDELKKISFLSTPNSALALF